MRKCKRRTYFSSQSLSSAVLNNSGMMEHMPTNITCCFEGGGGRGLKAVFLLNYMSVRSPR